MDNKTDAFVRICQSAVANIYTDVTQMSLREQAVRDATRELERVCNAMIAARDFGSLPGHVAVFSRTERVQLRSTLISLCDLDLYAEMLTKLAEELAMHGVPDEVCELIKNPPPQMVVGQVTE